MIHKQEFLALVAAEEEGRATPEQDTEFKHYMKEGDDATPGYIDTLGEEVITDMEVRLHEGIYRKIGIAEKKAIVPLYKKMFPYAAAAAILILVGVGIYNLFQPGKLKRLSTPVRMANDAAPGGNKAILTLADGSTVSLTDAANGKIGDQQGVDLRKAKTGQLVYTSAGAAAVTAFNTIATPKGGQYQVVLSDGTRVWLNAASSLKYPLDFSGNDRKVELSGEAYFEVAKNKAKPFKVRTAREEVTVLGTHFNINAYADEPATRTALLEGSVKVDQLNSEQSVTIKPGEAALVAGGAAPKIKVSTIDPDEVLAWQKGYFMFDAEPLESILRKIARWYDVEITYQSTASSQKQFSGTISKYSNASQVLRKLELTESVHFKIEGRNIIVLP